MPASIRLNPGLLAVWAVALALTIAGFYVAGKFVRPAPPSRIVIATGAPDGAYHGWAERLGEALAQTGIELELRPTAGSSENAELLTAEAVDLAIMQGGTAAGEGARGLASLFFEPVWIFHRSAANPAVLGDLATLRTSIGPEGSGTRALALDLLTLNGIDGATWPALSTAEAAEALQTGRIDAAVFVASERAASIQRLLADPAVQPMDLDRTPAYHLHRRHLAALMLPAGAVSLAEDVPARDTRLPGVAAMLVTDERLHPALVDLILIEAGRLDRDSLFAARGTFPSPRFLSVAIDPAAARFHERGPSFLQRYLPFWAATLIDRTIVLLLPLVALVIPMAKAFPPVYRWRVRSRIYRWYDDLQALERRIATEPDVGTLRALADRIEAEVDQVETPLSYSDELYDLKLHIDLVRHRIGQRRADESAT